MRLTAFTDYGLRTLMFVAQAPGGRTTIAETARGLALSENHLVKVVHALGKLGLLHNVRGRGGGFSLAGRCRLEGILHEALDAFHAVLERYTLEDLAKRTASSATRAPVALRRLPSAGRMR